VVVSKFLASPVVTGKSKGRIVQSLANTPTTSKGMLWTGRILTVLIGLFLLFDSGIKLVKARAAVEGSLRLGYSENLVVPIGAALFVCLVLYLIPRTSILGAILLTGYLGGATATMVRMHDSWFFFPVVIGILVWGALYLRDGRVRRMIPLQSE